MAQCVTGDLKDGLLGQLFEIECQIRQSSGYSFDPLALKNHLQEGIEGRFAKRASGLLAPIGTIEVSAVKKFSARKSFVEDTSAEAAVMISFVSDNFREWFGNKVETEVTGAVLRYAELLKTSLDGPILKELGATAEVKLAHVFALMKLQPNGEDGVLLTDGCVNIFYVCDTTGSLRAVFVYWYGVGWFVSAYSVSSQGEWDGGERVFSRNSSAIVTA